MFVTWVLVGGLIGVLARLVMKRGGYRVRKDITLGLVGSICGSWIFRAMGIFPKAGNSRDGRSWRLPPRPSRSSPSPIDVALLAGALKAGKLAQIRLELAYIPSPYREETLKFRCVSAKPTNRS